MTTSFSKTRVTLLDLLVPPRCGGCATPGSWLCVDCRDGLDPVHRTVGGLTVHAVGAFEGPLREAIHRAKYGNEPGRMAELGLLVATLIAGRQAHGTRVDVVVPVPLHPARRRERGYDQTALLARVITENTGVPTRAALHRIRRGPAQATLDRPGRALNVRSAFVGVAGSLAGAHVALVDDVATTGATLRDAAAAARACGARVVEAYVIGLDE